MCRSNPKITEPFWELVNGLADGYRRGNNRKVYDEYYKVYGNLYPALIEDFDKINNLIPCSQRNKINKGEKSEIYL